MLRSCLVAISILAMTVGATFAQAPTPGTALVIDATSDSSTQRVSDRDGVITDKPQSRTTEIIVPATDDKTTHASPAATTIR